MKEITRLNIEQERQFLKILYNCVIEVAQNHDKASPAELSALPEIAKLIASDFFEHV